VALKNKFRDDELVVCLESFASDHELGGCARGTLLRGNDAKVKRWPHFFVSASTDPEEIRRLRSEMWTDTGVPAPQ
jgi:hypothetical protein